jgi:hypothetical protein
VVIKNRELCPNCIDLTEADETRIIIREEEIYRVEKIILCCRSCNQELSNRVTLKFKHKMG